MRDAEFARDRRRNEAVGGRDHGAQVSGVEVPAGQRLGLPADHRADARVHEVGVPAGKVFRSVPGERFEGELQVCVDIQRAGLVLFEEGGVPHLVGIAVQHAPVDQELAPFIVAVPGQQRVVEVEQREIPGAHCIAPSASRTSGSVRGRLCDSEYSSRWSRMATSVGRSRRTWVSR